MSVLGSPTALLETTKLLDALLGTIISEGLARQTTELGKRGRQWLGGERL